MVPDLLRRVRWGNVARAGAIALALAALVLWPRVARDEPSLPDPSPVPLAAAPVVAGAGPHMGADRAADAATHRARIPDGHVAGAPARGPAGRDARAGAEDALARRAKRRARGRGARAPGGGRYARTDARRQAIGRRAVSPPVPAAPESPGAVPPAFVAPRYAARAYAPPATSVRAAPEFGFER